MQPIAMRNQSNSFTMTIIRAQILTDSNDTVEAVVLAADGFSIAGGARASTNDGDGGAGNTDDGVDVLDNDAEEGEPAHGKAHIVRELEEGSLDEGDPDSCNRTSDDGIGDETPDDDTGRYMWSASASSETSGRCCVRSGNHKHVCHRLRVGIRLHNARTGTCKVPEAADSSPTLGCGHMGQSKAGDYCRQRTDESYRPLSQRNERKKRLT